MSYTQHKQPRFKFVRRAVTSPTINNLVQCDLMIMSKYHQQNSHFKNLLVLIDVLSRYLHVYPLKSKKGEEIADRLDEFLTNANPRVNAIQCDRGTEFYNRFVLGVCRRHNVTLFSTYSPLKAQVSERVIKTLRLKIQKHMSHNRTSRYIDQLQNIVYAYNHTYHSRIKMRPVDVTPETQLLAWHNSYDKFFKTNVKPKQKFKVNDFVRIMINKGPFAKGSDKTFSNTVYIVADIIKSVPIMYKLKDSHGIVLGSFYNEELIKVNV